LACGVFRFFDTDKFFDEDWLRFPRLREWASRVPAANEIDIADPFEIEVAVSGMKKDEFSITQENGALCISAERKEEKKEKKENYTRREFSYAAFSRSFMLPETVKAEAVSAKYEEGVLRVHLPKKAAAKKLPKQKITVG